MSIRNRLRLLRAYTVWRFFRDQQQMEKFRRVVDRHLRDQRRTAGYGEVITRQRLKDLQEFRRHSLFGRHRLRVLAFGTLDWEQHGLWPAFERSCNLALFDYQSWIRNNAAGEKSEAVKTRLARAFLDMIDGPGSDGIPDVVFIYAAGTFIDDKLIPELSRRGIWSVVMGLDDKQQFGHSGHLVSDQMRLARQCDVYWTTWKTGTQIILGLGGNPWYAPEAADPQVFRPMSVPRDLHLLFVGKAYGMRMALVRHLQKRGFKVSTFGSGWPGGFASHEESVKLFSRAEIVLGTGGVGMTDRVKHIKGRDFEVPMCGALYLTSYNPELADHFAIGSEILCYGSPDECVDLVYWVDAHPEEADRIRNLGRTRALLDHTWDKRLGQLFALFPNSGISGDL